MFKAVIRFLTHAQWLSFKSSSISKVISLVSRVPNIFAANASSKLVVATSAVSAEDVPELSSLGLPACEVSHPLVTRDRGLNMGSTACALRTA
jgi:hypothetical protein